jgi:hypothetical protein
MTNLVKHIKIQSGAVFLWNPLGVNYYKKKGAIVGLGILFVASFD